MVLRARIWCNDCILGLINAALLQCAAGGLGYETDSSVEAEGGELQN